MNKSNKFSLEVLKRGKDGAGAAREVPINVGGHRVHRAQDRLRAADLE